jgi:hypothetical protein
MTDVVISNPPNAPAGYVAKWSGNEWSIVPIDAMIIPAKPENLPEGYSAEWNGSEWVVTPPEPPPPAPAPDAITGRTISMAVGDLQTIAYLTTSEMGQHITPESRQEVTDYIHAVANILATAQSKYGTGEAYAPTFPAMPTAMPQIGGDGLPAPFIQFIVVN